MLADKRVTVMRDSGCSNTVVRSSLVSPSQLTTGQKVCVLIDGTVRRFPVAKIKVDTPYYKGDLYALCVKNPVYDLIIGNDQGVRQAFDPDTDWKPSNADSQEGITSPDSNTSSTVVPKENNVKNEFRETIENIEQIQAVETRAMKLRKEKPEKKLNVASLIVDVSPEQFIEAQNLDKSLSHLWEKAKQPVENGKKFRFVVKNNILYRVRTDDPVGSTGSQVIIPTKFRESVMKLAHDSLLSGHLGISRTYSKILNQFYWPGMNQDVVNYCRSCDICQRTLAKGKVPKVPLGKVPMIDTPFHRIAMDLVGPMNPPTDRGNRFILTIIDYATRYPEAVPLRNVDTITVAESLVDIYARVGIPAEVLTDCGSQFTSDIMKEVSRLLSIRQMTSTPYHPQCNGLIERMNGTLKQMLKRMCSERPRDWDRYVSPLLFAYREAPQESLGFSPFELLYGRSVRGPMTILRELWTNEQPNNEIKTTYQYVIDLNSPEARASNLEICLPGLPYRQFWYHQVENTLGQLFSVGASQSRIAKQVKCDIKL